MTDRETVVKIFAEAIEGVDPYRALLPHLALVEELLRVGQAERLVVAGFGKAALPMALAVEAVLEARVDSGMVIVPHRSRLTPAPHRIQVATAGHPDPDAEGVAATRHIMELARRADDKTLLLLLVSGGGSSLLTAPVEEISLQEKQEISRLLMQSGADIEELNTVRKHLSAVKGGRLAALAHPARVITLAISDVPGDRPDLIASGPSCPDPSSFADALSVIDKFHLRELAPAAVLHHLTLGAQGGLPETPKPGDPLFGTVTTAVVARNRDAQRAAVRAAEHLGLKVRLRKKLVVGNARQAGKVLAEEALREQKRLISSQRLCVISGGETTVHVTGSGKGGRNQELALSFALALQGRGGVTFLSAGTDGIDGPTDAAGGVVDGGTADRARAAGVDPAASLADNDAYHLLERSGDLLKTGPTGTNVMDLQITLIHPKPRQST